MIDATYGHLAPDADERERTLLDAYDMQDASTLPSRTYGADGTRAGNS
jgi:hypothetical protein